MFVTPFKTVSILPSGIWSAPELFQKRMNTVFDGLNGFTCLMDDVLVFGKDQGEHDQRLKKVFERIQSVGVTLNSSKCVRLPWYHSYRFWTKYQDIFPNNVLEGIPRIEGDQLPQLYGFNSLWSSTVYLNSLFLWVAYISIVRQTAIQLFNMNVSNIIMNVNIHYLVFRHKIYSYNNNHLIMNIIVPAKVTIIQLQH